jgi:hypothetical protein
VRLIASISLSLLLAAGCASSPSASAPATPAENSDEFNVEATVLAAYNVISGPAGRHDWDRFKDLFAPGARLIKTESGADGVVKTVVMTPDEFATESQKYLQENSFFERPIAQQTVVFRDIAHVFSTYEARHASADAEPFDRGINSIQLVRSGDRWLIQTIFWQSADATHPIPSAYMPYH